MNVAAKQKGTVEVLRSRLEKILPES
jgi:hypothetical protein